MPSNAHFGCCLSFISSSLRIVELHEPNLLAEDKEHDILVVSGMPSFVHLFFVFHRFLLRLTELQRAENLDQEALVRKSGDSRSLPRSHVTGAFALLPSSICKALAAGCTVRGQRENLIARLCESPLDHIQWS